MKLLSVLLSALFLSTLNAEAVTSATVRDISGHNLRRGVEYYILPVYHGKGGGLTLASHNKSCPFNVAQESMEVAAGLPVTFSPVEPKDKTVKLSTDLNIEFSAVTNCMESTVWKLGGFDQSIKTWYVTVGGAKGGPGRLTVANWFKIETGSEGNDYKLVFCPHVCKFCKVVCKDVGVLYRNGKRWLVLTDDKPFPVMFRKKD